MIFDDIYARVQEDFRRPDKESQVRTKIREAIHSAHNADRFQMDAIGIVTSSLVCGGVTNCYAIDTSTVLPNFRDLISVQLYDETSGLASTEVELEDFPQATIDIYKLPRIPTVTQLGNSIQVKLGDTAGTSRKFYIQYLTFPVISDPVPESWIMRNYPFLIINDALARLYRTTGNAEQAGAKAADAEAQRRSLVSNSIVLGR